MLFWSIKITLLSFILIFLVHYLINFFKSTLTVPKIKDLVNTPTQKYENMFNTMTTTTPNSYDYTPPDIKPDVNIMKNELKSFLKKQLKGEREREREREKDNGSTNIDTLDAFSENNYTYV